MKPDAERHPIVRRRSSDPGYRSCGARKRDGDRCTKPCGWGTDHPGFGQCKYHGGSTIVGDRIAAREELVKVNTQLRLSGLRKMAPADALSEELARSAGAVAYFDEAVARIQLVGEDRDEDGYELLSPVALGLIELWTEQRRHYVQVAALAARAGIDERQIQIMETTAQAVVAATMAVLAELDLTPEQTARAKVAMATKLRALSAAS